MIYLAETDPEAALGPLQAAACTYRIALGPRAGQKVLTLQTVPSQEAPPTEQHCVNAQGFSLHAEVRLFYQSAIAQIARQVGVSTSAISKSLARSYSS
jgi:hypothetical protein